MDKYFPYNYSRFQDTITSLNFLLFVPLLIGTFWWYLPRIMKLHQKEFHFLMLSLNVSSYVCVLLSQFFETLWYNRISQPSDLRETGTISLFRASKILMLVYLTTDTFVHTIFVVKYWVLSRKITQIMNKTDDPYIERRAQVIFYSLSGMIFGTFFAGWYYIWNDYSLDDNVPVEIVSIFMFLPNIIVFGLFFSAIRKLRESTDSAKYQIDIKLVVFQSLTYILQGIS